jgi:hypothetical protein
MASGRTAFACAALGALVWVNGFTVLVYCFTKSFFPKGGRNLTLVFLSALFGSLYLLVLFMISPLLAMETTLIVILAPVSCISSGIVSRTEILDRKEGLVRAVFEALILGGLILALALIREPLGYGSLSLPGGRWGIIELFDGSGGMIFPVRIISGTAGALLLLGYGLALFRHFRNRYTHEEENQ